MDYSQIFYAALLAGAIWWGGPDWRLSAICVGNFAGTMILSASPISVGVLDMATIAVLIYVGTWRGHALAAIFVALVPIYLIGEFLSWPSYATYAIIDVLGYSIPGVLASGSGGHRHRRAAGCHRGIRISRPAAFRMFAARGMGRDN